jgi:hypothetical protein
MGNRQYNTLSLTLTPLNLFLPEGGPANFASDRPARPRTISKPPTPMAGATIVSIRLFAFQFLLNAMSLRERARPGLGIIELHGASQSKRVKRCREGLRQQPQSQFDCGIQAKA